MFALSNKKSVIILVMTFWKRQKYRICFLFLLFISALLFRDIADALLLSFLYRSFPCGSADKESACNARDLGSVPGFGRSSGEGKGYPLQYTGLENSMDCVSWGHKELNTTERLPPHFFYAVIMFSYSLDYEY